MHVFVCATDYALSIQVQITLAESDQYMFRNCDGCQYTVCLCGQESRTFSWIVTPSSLGTNKLKSWSEIIYLGLHIVL